MSNKPATKPADLTKKETALFIAVVVGMDEPGQGWLHELADKAGLSGKELSGVVSSLIKKKMIYTEENCGEHYVEISKHGRSMRFAMSQAGILVKRSGALFSSEGRYVKAPRTI